MRVAFHPDALAEFLDARGYDNSQRPGLGDEFADEIAAGLDRIQQFPNGWTIERQNTRLYVANRFPYGIVYELGKDEIRVVAIAHLKRRSRYWRKRTFSAA